MGLVSQSVSVCGVGCVGGREGGGRKKGEEGGCLHAGSKVSMSMER